MVLVGAFLLYRTKFGRRVRRPAPTRRSRASRASRSAGVRTMAFVIQGICVAIAAICYVPRLGAATPTTGPAVGTAGHHRRRDRRHRAARRQGRIWGTVAGALILEMIANLMVLSDMVSEYLVAAVQGVIIIIAMLAHRFLR